MADAELLNVGYVVAGGLIGSLMITLFPYFTDKRAVEIQQSVIRMKQPETRTPEEQYLLDLKYPGFFDEYRFRFFFGLLTGIGATIAFLNSGLTGVSAMTASQAIFAGFTASGMFSALADKIVNVGSATLVKAKAAVANK